MTFSEKYDKIPTGMASAILLPVITGIIIWLVSAGNYSLGSYLVKIVRADIITHIISLCVFPNVIIFLIFNRFDMLQASRGVLGVTIAWAITVFLIKFL